MLDQYSADAMMIENDSLADGVGILYSSSPQDDMRPSNEHATGTFRSSDGKSSRQFELRLT
jgi:hypothetical protein